VVCRAGSGRFAFRQEVCSAMACAALHANTASGKTYVPWIGALEKPGLGAECLRRGVACAG
jgi:hypothetical protein